MSFSFDAAKQQAEEQAKAVLGDHDATIAAASAVISSSGNPMINLRWKQDDTDQVVFDRLIFAPARMSIERLEAFCNAIGRDANEEFSGVEIDLPWLTEWCQGNADKGITGLIGEQATISVGLDKGSVGSNGKVYAPKPEVKKYQPVGSVVNANSLLDIE